MSLRISLSPAQEKLAAEVLAAIPAFPLVVLRCSAGMGRSSILRNVRDRLNGPMAGVSQFMRLLKDRDPLAIEEAFVDLVESSDGDDVLIVDDLHLLQKVVGDYSYPRQQLLDLALTALLDVAESRQKPLVFGFDDGVMPPSLYRRAQIVELKRLTPEDYASICQAYLPSKPGDRVDYAKVHRFAPFLNVWQLRKACASLRNNAALDTDAFIE